MLVSVISSVLLFLYSVEIVQQQQYFNKIQVHKSDFVSLLFPFMVN